jgi:TonB family protein
MTKALRILGCVLGTGSLPFTPLLAAPASANPPAGVGISVSCRSAHTDAAVLFAAPADMPTIGHEMGFSGTTYLEVDLAPNGKLAATRVVGSSGDALVDAAAISAARSSTFRPETVNCVPISGRYLHVVKFER